MNNSILKQLADSVEQMAKTDFEKTPNFMCMYALIDSLVDAGVCGQLFSKKIVFRMKIMVSSFDPNDDDWKRIISNYVLIIGALYKMVGDGDTMLEIASTLTLNYKV